MSTVRSKTLPSIILVLVTVFMASLFGVVAAAPVRVLRLFFGQKFFWSLLFFLVSIFAIFEHYSLAITLGTLAVLMGSFAEFEKNGDHLYKASICSLLTTTTFLLITLMVWILVKGKGSLALLQSLVFKSFEPVNALYIKYNGSELLTPELKKIITIQSPSIIITALIVSLFLGLVLDRYFFNLVGLKNKRTQHSLVLFQLNSAVIWTFIFTFLGSFFETSLPYVKVISVNIFNVCIVLLFFQGLAVLGHFFATYRVSKIWRVLWVFMLALQLPIVLGFIGLMDYWLNFRGRFARHEAQVRRSQ